MKKQRTAKKPRAARSNLSFQQAVLLAAKSQTKNDIRAEVTEAATIVANETKKSLISTKQRLDALEELLKNKLGLADKDFIEALWAVQEKAYGLEVSQDPAEKGSGIRFVVKEEIEGYETDSEPTQESFIVLGQDDDQLPKELLDALTGSSAGETKKVKLYSEQVQKNYTVTLKVQRVYKEKAKN
jgi:hypothetical protein